MDAFFSHLTPATLAYYFAVINVVAFAAFGVDKQKASMQQQRISEATLLQLAFFGGSPGAYAGRHLFRHKTRKQPFSSTLFTIVVIQLLALGAMLGWWVSG